MMKAMIGVIKKEIRVDVTIQQVSTWDAHLVHHGTDLGLAPLLLN